jgi:hypothetical protein
MEVTKWLKPSISVSRFGDSASVQAATRVNVEQASHDEGLVKGSHYGDIEIFSSCFGIQGPSPFARHGPFPSTVNLTCGRRSWQLHQDPAFGGQGSGRREPFSKAAFQATVCFGSSTWIRQD